MAIYPGILIRANDQDKGNINRSGPFTGCPDIIPWGQLSVNDPQATFGTATGSNTSYDKNPGQAISGNNVNYIYLRGKNTGSSAIDNGQVYLYWLQSNLLLYPEQWLSPNQMIRPDASSRKDYVSMSAAPSAICVGTQPFVWLNPPPPPPGTHYCLVTIAGTPDQVAAMTASGKKITSQAGLAAWVAANGGTGWRNVDFTTVGQPDFSTLTNYQAGSAVSTVNFQLICNNVPAGSEVAFSCPVPNPGGEGYYPIECPWTSIPPPKGGKNGDTVRTFSVGLKTLVGANYVSGFYYQYRSNGWAKPAGFNITLEPLVYSTGSDELKDHPLLLADYLPDDTMMFHPGTRRFTQGLHLLSAQDLNIPVACPGSHTTTVEPPR